MPGVPRLSVIVPFFNEEQNIRGVHQAILAALESSGISFEMLFVDDGSTDRTFEIAEQLARDDSRVRVVKFRRNYGQTPAMAAGIEHACGEILVTMDGDLQNDPGDIPMFLEKMDEGYDIVVGWRHNRQDKLITRKIPSRIANGLIGKVTGVAIRDNGCSLKAYRATVIKRIPLYSEMHRFIPAVASIAGPRVAEIKVRHYARKFGSSKYGLSRIYKVLLDLLVIKTVASFASRPLVWFLYLSVPMLLISAAAWGYQLYATLVLNRPWSLSMAGLGLVFIISALILTCSGLLAELIYKTGDMRDFRFARLTQRVASLSRTE